MKREEIEQKVNEVLIDVLGIDQAEIRNDAKLEDDLNTDSLDCVEIVMGLEHEFMISIPDEKAEDVTTVGELYDMVWEIL
jgi:acyl carrier protein